MGSVPFLVLMMPIKDSEAKCFDHKALPGTRPRFHIGRGPRETGGFTFWCRYMFRRSWGST